MKVIYLGHSGFFVETDDVQYLFDYIRGDLPENLGEKPLYVFASHAHQDHFDPKIFASPLRDKVKGYILGFDIEPLFKEKKEEWLGGEKKIVMWADPSGRIKTRDFGCTSLTSTDEGVAFLIKEGNTKIYHAGDLNWWHWNVDGDDVNAVREMNFKHEVDQLKGEKIAVACVPLDPRLEQAYRYCMDYFLETIDAEHVFPMHFWKDYGLIGTYMESCQNDHPDWAARFEVIDREGQEFKY